MFDFLYYIPVIGTPLATIVPFIIVLGIVITVHELGHYIVGRMCGIHAEVFSLGFGKVLTSRVDKRGTKWQIAAIPLGGYVRFLDDGDAASSPGAQPIDEALKEKTFGGAKLYKRVLTVSAGPIANFLLTITLFAGIVYLNGIPSNEPVVGKLASLPQTHYQLKENDRILAINGAKIESFTEINDVTKALDFTKDIMYLVKRDGQELDVVGPYPLLALVSSVVPISPASKAGLKKGDLILSVGGVELQAFSQLQAIIMATKNTSVDLKVWRDNEVITIPITPRYSQIQIGEARFDERMNIGVNGTLVFDPTYDDVSLFKSINYGVTGTYRIIIRSMNGIYFILKGIVGVENLQGPLGIAQVSGEMASAGFMSFIQLIAIISTAIGFLNLLPIPVLDGGHLVTYAFEAVFRRAPNPKALQATMLIGLTLLLSLMIFATFNDITRWVQSLS